MPADPDTVLLLPTPVLLRRTVHPPRRLLTDAYPDARVDLHGRRVCTARKPGCDTCVLAEVCPSVGA